MKQKETEGNIIDKDRADDNALVNLLLFKRERLHVYGGKRIASYYIQIMKNALYNLPE